MDNLRYLKNKYNLEGENFLHRIFINEPKITKLEFNPIIFIIAMNYAMTKSTQSCWKLFETLKYYEYEDEELRIELEESISTLIKDQRRETLLGDLHVAYLTYDNPINDRFFEGKIKQENFLRRHFPLVLAQSPFIRFHIRLFKFWPYFEVGSMRFELLDIQHFGNTCADSAIETYNEGALEWL